jgi:hypothetical protein
MKQNISFKNYTYPGLIILNVNKYFCRYPIGESPSSSLSSNTTTIPNTSASVDYNNQFKRAQHLTNNNNNNNQHHTSNNINNRAITSASVNPEYLSRT